MEMSASNRLAALRRYVGRWETRDAASDTVSLGTWIVTALALSLLLVALVATPNDPVRAWLSTAFNQAATISSVQGSSNPSG